jgi:hypothetical protein
MALGGPQGDEQPPAPGYTWNGTAWVPPAGGAQPPTTGVRLGGAQGDELPPAPGYTWDGNNWVPPPTTDPNAGSGWKNVSTGGATVAQGSKDFTPTTTTAAAVDQKKYDEDALKAGQVAQGISDQAGITPGHWETVPGPNGTSRQVYVPGTTGQAPRAAPQAAAPPTVTSNAPAAAQAAAPTAVTSTAVTAPIITPIERIQAATINPTAGATAGVVNAAPIDTDPQAQFRAQQARLTAALEAQAAGTAPTAGELAARRQADDAVAAQRSLASSVHGYSALSAARGADRNIAGIQSRSALDQALLRQKGVEDARTGLANVLGQGREQDIGLAVKGAELKQGADTTTAQLGTQVSISNADREAARNMKQADLEQAASAGNAAAQNELNNRQAALKLAADTTTSEQQLKADQGNQATQTQVNLTNTTEANKVGLADAEMNLRAQLGNADNATKVALANAGFTLEGRQIDDARNVEAIKAALAAQAATLQSDQQRVANELAQHQLDEAIKRGDREATLGIITAIVGSLGAVGAGAATQKSDRRAKKNINRATGKQVDDLLSAMEAWTYDYKDQKDGGGKRMGPMAQELERSTLGKGMVKTGPDGHKRVDTGALTMALAGAVARLAKQQRRAGRGA